MIISATSSSANIAEPTIIITETLVIKLVIKTTINNIIPINVSLPFHRFKVILVIPEIFNKGGIIHHYLIIYVNLLMNPLVIGACPTCKKYLPFTLRPEIVHE